MTAVAREWWDTGASDSVRASATVRKRLSLKVRFWRHVDRTGGRNACWPWTAGVQSAGYGAFCINKQMELAHRVAYVLRHGPIDAEMYVLHSLKCTTKLCCNWRHLRQGTQLENMHDFMKLLHRKQRKPSKALRLFA